MIMKCTGAHVTQAKSGMRVYQDTGVFSPGSPVFALPTDWTISYELK